MQKTIQVGDATHTVDVEADPAIPGRFRARIGEREVSVELKPVTGAARVLVVDGKPYSIAIARDRERTWVQVGPEAFQCETVQGRKRAGAAGKLVPEVKSPIAGKVLKLFVKVGDAVAAGQKLISIEAMKMENEIHATLAGTVARVPVQAGQTVQPGDLLLVLEPEKAAQSSL